MAIGTGVKSALGVGKRAMSRSMTGETLKGLGKKLTSSSFVKDTVSPGLKSAWKGTGGGTGLARRVLGGAAIGGTATGSISALRGGDFWEGAKSGALTGAVGGAARHGYQMSQTGAGKGLTSAIGDQYRTSKNTAANTQARRDFSDMGVNPNSRIKGEATNHYKRSGEYRGRSFWDNAKSDIRTAKDATGSTARAKSEMRKKGRDASGIFVNDAGVARKRLKNESNQVYTLRKAQEASKSSQAIVNRRR